MQSTANKVSWGDFVTFLTKYSAMITNYKKSFHTLSCNNCHTGNCEYGKDCAILRARITHAKECGGKCGDRNVCAVTLAYMNEMCSSADLLEDPMFGGNARKIKNYWESRPVPTSVNSIKFPFLLSLLYFLSPSLFLFSLSSDPANYCTLQTKGNDEY
jgi:hypothetical protein